MLMTKANKTAMGRMAKEEKERMANCGTVLMKRRAAMKISISFLIN